MAWTKSKTAVVVGAYVLLAEGTAIIASLHKWKSMRSIRDTDGKGEITLAE